MTFIDDMLNRKNIEKQAAQVPLGENKETTEANKLQANAWISDLASVDADAVEKEYQEKLAEEARMLGKTAAQEEFKSPEQVIESDYARQVKAYSDSNLMELLALARAHKDNVTAEQFSEYREKAKANVESGRAKCEEELLKLAGEHTLLDWQAAFKKFSKDAPVEQPAEKKLYAPEVPEKEADFSKPSEDKFKLPTKEEMVPEGNGREADKCKEVTKEAAKKEPHTEECNKANDKHVGPTEVCICDQKKIAEKVKNNPADDKGNLAMPEGKKSAGDKPVESVEESTLLSSPKEVGDKDDQAMEGNSPEKGDKAKDIESVNKEASEIYCKNSDCKAKATVRLPEGNYCGKHAPAKKEAHCGSCPGDPGVKEAASPLFRPLDSKTVPTPANTCDSCGADNPVGYAECRICKKAPVAKMAEPMNPLKREELPCEGCPVCGGEGTDLKNNEKDHISCMACGITYAPAEIKSQASKEDVLKIMKTAEVNSPWAVVIDPTTGKECIARVGIEDKNIKESEEDIKDELKK